MCVCICTVKWAVADQQLTQHGSSYCTGTPMCVFCVCVCLRAWLCCNCECLWCRATVGSAICCPAVQLPVWKMQTSFLTGMSTVWNPVCPSWVCSAPFVSVCWQLKSQVQNYASFHATQKTWCLKSTDIPKYSEQVKSRVSTCVSLDKLRSSQRIIKDSVSFRAAQLPKATAQM